MDIKTNTIHKGSEDKLIIDSTYEYDNTIPLLSVVIPVYKVEKYLPRCLDSITKQTYKNIEIIVVNDASPDNEEDIIQNYCAQDSRIKYVKHIRNMGLFQARITGMKYSTGDYFAFLDSDDHISIDYYRLLINKISSSKSDIVIGDFLDEYEDGRIEYYNYDNTRFVDLKLEGKEVYDTFMKQLGLWFGWHTVWNKIYSKSVWNNSHKILEQFSKEHGHLIMTEDIAFSCVFWKFAEKVTNCHNAYYYYFHHSGQSVANSNFDKFAQNLKDVFSVFCFFENFLKSQNIYQTYRKDFEEFRELYIEFWTGNADALEEKDQKKGRSLVVHYFKHVCEMNYKDHYHYSCRTSLSSFKFYEDIKKNICSDKTKVVSFDIFDTLLLRPFYKPSDIFALMNKSFNKFIDSYSYVDFQKIRINAEADLRKELSPIEEITLEQIYHKIAQIFNLSDKKINCLMKQEIDLELKFIRARNTGKELFDLANLMNKKIVCTSDMYLPKEVVLKLLNKCGYSIDNIYLSSEYLLTKHSGNLYDLLIKKEDVNANEIVHIGDNWDSDVVMANSKGIRAYHLASPISLLRGENPGTFTGWSFYKIWGPSGKIYMGESAAEYLGIRCMLGMIANKIFDNPYIVQFNQYMDFNCNAYFIGYYIVGMHLYAVANWINQIAINEKKNTIHFVSRDGYLPKKAFDILKKYRNINSKSNYLYISRKATALLQGNTLADIESYINSFSSFCISVKTPLDTFEPVSQNEFRNNLSALSDNNIISFNKTKDFTEAMQYGDFLYNKYIDNEKVKKYVEDSKQYFSEIIGDNDILFDLGYRANKEHILSSLLERPIDCMYIYTNESKAIERAINKNFVIRTFYDYTPSAYAATRELLFSEIGPSCIGYNFEKEPYPIFEETYNEHYFNKFIVSTMQKGALDFVQDFEECFSNTEVVHLFRNFDASLPFEYFMNLSLEADRNIFGCITFEDDTFAGGQIKLVDEWQKAIVYHKLNIQNISSMENRNNSSQVQTNNKQAYYLENEIYPDGLYIKAFSMLNKKFPFGSKRREVLKGFLKIFIH